VCGSISHTRQVAAVAVARVSDDTASLGLDIESDAPLRDALWHIVFTEAERRWLTSTADAKVVFSAKEALYKAQYPISGEFLGFDAVDVELDHAADRFAATFRVNAGPIGAGTCWTGRVGRGEGIVATALQVRRATSGYVTS
jgi:4'-phosphopantetheinyl transferase EntD